MVNNETFFNLSKLVSLNFYKSELIEIGLFTFGSSLKGLKHLNLSFNRLELIKANIFVNLSNLLKLDISNNRIMQIENSGKLKFLTNVFMSYTKIYFWCHNF